MEGKNYESIHEHSGLFAWSCLFSSPIACCPWTSHFAPLVKSWFCTSSFRPDWVGGFGSFHWIKSETFLEQSLLYTSGFVSLLLLLSEVNSEKKKRSLKIKIKYCHLSDHFISLLESYLQLALSARNLI